MRYYSEKTVKKIMGKVEVIETQISQYDNLYAIQRIYPNLNKFNSIDIPEPHGELKDATDILNRLALKPFHDATSALLSIASAFDESPVILEASK